MPAHDLERLWGLAQGRLDPAEAAETRAHVAGCTECARELAEIETAARALATVEVPERAAAEWRALDAKVLGAARARMAQGGLRRLWELLAAERWVTVGAVAALAVLIAVYVVRRPASSPSPVQTPEAVAGVQPAPAPPSAPGLAPGPAVTSAPGPAAEAGPELASVKVVTATSASAGSAKAPLRSEQRVAQGSRVATGARGEAVLALSEGSVIALEQHGQLTLAAVEPAQVRLELAQGEVVVAASHREARTFEVVAGSAVVRVVGTRFSVERGARATTVKVVEGKVRVSANGRQTDVRGGEQLTVTDEWGLKVEALREQARQSLAPVVARLERVMKPEPPAAPAPDHAGSEEPPTATQTPEPSEAPERLDEADAAVALQPSAADASSDGWVQPFALNPAPDAGSTLTAEAEGSEPPVTEAADAGARGPWLKSAMAGVQNLLNVDWSAPFPPVGMTMEEYQAHQLERLADAGQCRSVLRRADEWEARYVLDAGTAPDPGLYRIVKLTRRRCEKKLGR